MRISRDGTQRQILIDQSDGTDSNMGDWLGGIAVDWLAKNIYWTDQKRDLIEVMRLDGRHRYVVVSNVEKAHTITLDPLAGVLFYAGEGKIGRINLDGSQPFILVNQSVSVSSMTLDRVNQVVYWCERSTDTIMRADYDGNNRRVVVNSTVYNPTALDFIDGTLYYVEEYSGGSSIKAFEFDTISHIRDENSAIKDLKFFSKRKQTGSNACSVNNGGCQELCLYNGTRVCACSHGRIAPDNQSCEEYDTFLIFSKVNAIESIHLSDYNNKNGPIAKIQNSTYLKNTIALAYDHAQSKIFYSDIHWGTINWVYFNGTNHTQIVNKQVTVEGLAFDPVSNSLFWTSNSDASIRSINMQNITDNASNNTEMVKQIIHLKGHDKLRGIAVDSCVAMLYWTNWNAHAPSIQRAYVSGYGTESIITTEIRMPNAITLDVAAKKLYWADARLDKIEKADYDGTNRIVLAHSTPKHPFAMTIFEDSLFWTDWILHAVIKCNKHSGGDVTFLRRDVGRPMGITAVQDSAQNCTANPCNVLNGGCEDVCALDQTGNIHCICTQGVRAEDGKRCLPQNRTSCGNGQFQCSDGSCIPYFLTCDTVPHCADGSDESVRFCSKRSCPYGYFQCNNHRCILANQTCNGEQECGDGSDEAVCECDTNLHFRCNNGQCIDIKNRCDYDPGKPLF